MSQEPDLPESPPYVGDASWAVGLRAAPSPCFVVNEALLEANLKLLRQVQDASGAKVLLALKSFALWRLAPLVMKYLAGTCTSGLHEATLGRQEFGGEVHVYAPAFKDAEMSPLLELVDHISFNSPAQWRRFASCVRSATRPVSPGLRINPQHSEVTTPLYDPCAPGSRLGSIRSALDGHGDALAELEGLHFHTLCELNADALVRTLKAVEDRFGDVMAAMPGLRWFNFGGGHHITRPDYDVDLLVRTIRDFRQRRATAVYLEPGEAVALGTGVLIASVLDVLPQDVNVAILDTSATTHMPDVLEMPYRPHVLGPDGEPAGRPGEHQHTFRLGGLSCLAGDVIGDFSFRRPLQPGDRLVFADMGHYTMVKTTTFNGVPLPAIAGYDPRTAALRVFRRFDYRDYRDRLA